MDPKAKLARRIASAGKPKNWIAGAIEHPGALRAELGVKGNNPIPTKKLRKAAQAGGVLGRRARLAETLRGLNH